MTTAGVVNFRMAGHKKTAPMYRDGYYYKAQ